MEFGGGVRRGGMILAHGNNLPLLSLSACRLRFLHYESGQRTGSPARVCRHTAQTIDQAEVSVRRRHDRPFLLGRAVGQRLDNARPAHLGSCGIVERIRGTSGAGSETGYLKVAIQVACDAPLLAEAWSSAIGLCV